MTKELKKGRKAWVVRKIWTSLDEHRSKMFDKLLAQMRETEPRVTMGNVVERAIEELYSREILNK